MQMPVLLFRRDLSNEREIEIASKYFLIAEQRCAINKREFVIPRYSFLPHAKEFEMDINLMGGKLVNSYKQHLFSADIVNWYSELEKYTFKTWFSAEEVPGGEAQFVVKGRTNSRKFNWNRKMYVPSRAKLGEVIAELMEDPFIAEQGLCIREYKPLRTFHVAENGMRITEEYRLFFYGNTFIEGGYYWSSHTDKVPEDIWKDRTFLFGYKYFIYEFAKEIADICQNHIKFYCLDIGITEDGKPVLVEINDGTMSGLSCINPDKFYENLSRILK